MSTDFLALSARANAARAKRRARLAVELASAENVRWHPEVVEARAKEILKPDDPARGRVFRAMVEFYAENTALQVPVMDHVWPGSTLDWEE